MFASILASVYLFVVPPCEGVYKYDEVKTELIVTIDCRSPYGYDLFLSQNSSHHIDRLESSDFGQTYRTVRFKVPPQKMARSNVILNARTH